jgi:hypothetical protein
MCDMDNIKYSWINMKSSSSYLFTGENLENS